MCVQPGSELSANKTIVERDSVDVEVPAIYS
uniref:Uncharacterized protein n=1 Tax=Arundo donax TaxID=35708 RepID=A0A0A9HUZ9_ARUDO